MHTDAVSDNVAVLPRFCCYCHRRLSKPKHLTPSALVNFSSSKHLTPSALVNFSLSKHLTPSALIKFFIIQTSHACGAHKIFHYPNIAPAALIKFFHHQSFFLAEPEKMIDDEKIL